METKKYLDMAIAEARQGEKEGGIPIGAVIVCQGKVIGKGRNKRIQEGSVIKHGEMDALENAGRLTSAIYQSSTLYTTLSPCPMCSGAILLYGIKKVVVGENSNFLGDEDHLRKNGVEVIVLQDDECIQMMKSFIKRNPQLWNEDIGV
ncbi:MAG: nucleoside deaminase [Desulforhopalus sp.]|nr:nucleoside deaminase [Desulforhopalus sp.]